MWELSKLSIFEIAARPREMQQPGAAAVGKGLLRNQLFWEVKIKIRNQHQLDYRTCGTQFREDQPLATNAKISFLQTPKKMAVDPN
jgi:hypothetical protein